MFLILSFCTFSQQSKVSIAELVTHNRGNLTINFRSTELVNQGSLFSLPPLKERFSLSINELIAKKSFSPFIFGHSFSLNADIKLSKSHFKNFKSNAISISSAIGDVDIANTPFVGQGSGTSFYGRNDEGISVTVDTCSFSNFHVVSNQTDSQSFLNSGGVFYLYNPTTIDIQNSVFDDCLATVEGGAILIYQSSGDIMIQGCQFLNCTSCFGTAIALEFSQNATVSSSFFVYCNYQPYSASRADGCTVFSRDTELTARDLTFYHSFRGEDVTAENILNSVEIGVTASSNPKSLTTTRICSTVHPDMPLTDYIIVYYFNPPQAVTATATDVFADRAGVYLYYFTASSFAQSTTESNVTDCPTIPTPYIPTPAPTQYVPSPAPSELPPTPAPSEYIPTPEPSIIPEISSEDISSEISSEVNISSEPTAAPTSAPTNADNQETGLTDSQKITIAWVVPLVIIILIIIAIVIYCLLKDRRKAFKGDQIEGDEYAFPAV